MDQGVVLAAVAVEEVKQCDPPRKDKGARRGQEWRALFVQHYLPLAFAVAIGFALAWPAPGKAVVGVVVLGDVRLVQDVLMGVVFFISGLTLNTKELHKARGHVKAVVFGFLSILIITPCMGFVMREIPLRPKLFSIGLATYCVVPTTLGVGVALVRSCYGNEAIALLMTVGTNMLGVVTVPIALKVLFLGAHLSGLSVRVDILDLFIKLLVTILAPSVLGKALRELCHPAELLATRYRAECSMLSTTCLAIIIWQTLSGARDVLFASQGAQVVAMLGLAASLYSFYLAFNYVMFTWLFKVPTPEAIALIIISSQKSAPVAVTIFGYITRDPAELGLLAIPAIVGQLTQIFLGAAMVPPLANRARRYYQQQAADSASQVPTTGQGPDSSTAAGAVPARSSAMASNSTDSHSSGDAGPSLTKPGPSNATATRGTEESNGMDIALTIVEGEAASASALQVGGSMAQRPGERG